MAKINLNRAEMESERIQMCLQPHSVQGHLTGDMQNPVNPSDRVMQNSQAFRMDWGGNVEMPEDQNIDCTDNYGDIDMSSSRMTSENLGLKKKTESEITMAESTQIGPFETDINIKVAGRRVFPPVETKDEIVVPLKIWLGVKNRTLKRTMTEKPDWMNTTYTQDPVKQKYTDDLIQKIKTGEALKEAICISYNLELFSNTANLQPLTGAKINNGSFGDVMKVKDTQTGQSLVKKMVKKNSNGKFEVERNEIEIPLQFPDFKNIARFFGLAYTGKELVYIMEDAGMPLCSLSYAIRNLRDGIGSQDLRKK